MVKIGGKHVSKKRGLNENMGKFLFCRNMGGEGEIYAISITAAGGRKKFSRPKISE